MKEDHWGVFFLLFSWDSSESSIRGKEELYFITGLIVKPWHGPGGWPWVVRIRFLRRRCNSFVIPEGNTHPQLAGTFRAMHHTVAPGPICLEEERSGADSPDRQDDPRCEHLLPSCLTHQGPKANQPWVETSSVRPAYTTSNPFDTHRRGARHQPSFRPGKRGSPYGGASNLTGTSGVGGHDTQDRTAVHRP